MSKYSNITGVFYKTNNCREYWVSTWYAPNSRQKSKSFSVSKHGFTAAKKLAEEHRTSVISSLPKKTTTTASLPHSNVNGVYWDNQQRTWITRMIVKNRMITRSFAARKYGFSSAQKLAETTRLENQEMKTRRKLQAKFRSNIKGVSWIELGKQWRAYWVEQGKQRSRTFSSVKYGFENALKLAIETRRMAEDKSGEK